MIDALWYKHAVIYSLNVETFMDGNGDGIGDFPGLTRRLDYLHGIGATCIWLLPFQPSPRKDHGYDVADYYAVDPRFGTLGDFTEFTHGCEQRGMRVIMDLVFNHTSDQHPWFQQSRSGPDNPKADWYIWSEEEPKKKNEGMVFPGKQDSVWDYDEERKAWYFHRFFEFQPDLNLRNADVREEILKIMGFWIKLGVSGFRLDAVPFIIDVNEHEAEEQAEDFGFLREMRQIAQFRKGDCVLLAEANVPIDRSAEYFGESGERLHMMFNFKVNEALFYALATADTGPLKKALEETRRVPATSQWCQFLRNHDELDLSGLTKGQRQKVLERFAPKETMRLFDRGIRRRLAPMLDGDFRVIKLANSVMMSLPGTPLLRYGDEIGMGDDLRLEGRGAVRTAMQWDEHSHGGFSCAEEAKVAIISEGKYGYAKINVSDQRRDPESLLNWTERIIRLRQEVPEIGYGKYTVLESEDEVLALRYDWREATAIVIHNFSDESRQMKLPAQDEAERSTILLDLLADDHPKPDARGGYLVSLDPYAYRWFRVDGDCR
jgi:maltose alpha-D-glucosyltransferase / alpha-amylase